MEKTPISSEVQAFTSEHRKRLIIYIVAILLINIALAMYINTSGATNLAGEEVSPVAVVRATFITLFIGIPFIGFILGLVISILPYKQLSYSKKYLRASLISILLIHIVTLILAIRNLILF